MCTLFSHSVNLSKTSPVVTTFQGSPLSSRSTLMTSPHTPGRGDFYSGGITPLSHQCKHLNCLCIAELDLSTEGQQVTSLSPSLWSLWPPPQRPSRDSSLCQKRPAPGLQGQKSSCPFPASFTGHPPPALLCAASSL